MSWCLSVSAWDQRQRFGNNYSIRYRAKNGLGITNGAGIKLKVNWLIIFISQCAGCEFPMACEHLQQEGQKSRSTHRFLLKEIVYEYGYHLPILF